MELEINGAIKAQLSTLRKADQLRAERILKQVAEDPHMPASVKSRLASDPNLWQVKISPTLRALVRITNGRVSRGCPTESA